MFICVLHVHGYGGLTLTNLCRGIVIHMQSPVLHVWAQHIGLIDAVCIEVTCHAFFQQLVTIKVTDSFF